MHQSDALLSPARAQIVEVETYTDPGWLTTACQGSSISVHEGAWPRASERSGVRMHSVVGMTERRGAFALSCFFDEGEPRQVIGVRSFNEPSQYWIFQILNRSRPDLGSPAPFDVAQWNESPSQKIDLGVVSRTNPLLLSIDKITYRPVPLNLMFWTAACSPS